MTRPKLVVFSHAAVLDVNRALFQAFANQKQMDVVMVVPRVWKGDLIRDLNFQRSANDGTIAIVDLPVRIAGNGSLFFYGSGVGAVLQQESPDLVLVDEEPWSVCAAQISWHLPKKARMVFYTKQNLKKTIPLPFRVLERWIFGKSRAALSVESEVEEVLRWKGYTKPVFDFPHSFDPILFHARSAEEKTRFRDSLGLSASKILVLYCGRLTEEKGIRDLMRAMGDLRRVKDLEFLIVGNGPLFAETENFCKSFIGTKAVCVPALPHDKSGALMSCADILVLPSRTTPAWKEQFGRVLVEAMACGLAVVGSDSGAIGRVVQRCGGGLVFPEGDARAMAEALDALVCDPSRLGTFKAAGAAYVNRELTHAAMAEKLGSYLTRLMS